MFALSCNSKFLDLLLRHGDELAELVLAGILMRSRQVLGRAQTA